MLEPESLNALGVTCRFADPDDVEVVVSLLFNPSTPSRLKVVDGSAFTGQRHPDEQ